MNATLTFALFWLFFSIVFVLMLFITINAKVIAKKYKLKAALTCLLFILGLISFCGIFLSFQQPSLQNELPVHKPKADNTYDKPKPSVEPALAKEKGYSSRFKPFPDHFDAQSYHGKSVTSEKPKIEVGKDVKPGYYTITLEKAMYSTISIYNIFGEEFISEVLNKKQRPTQINTYLLDKQIITTEDKTKLKFTPKQHEHNNKLNIGNYIVGTDVDPGDYLIYQSDIGSIEITNPNNDYLIRHSFEGRIKQKPLEVTLRKNDLIKVTGSAEFKLEKKN